MDSLGPKQNAAATPARARYRRVLVRTAAWIIAVPALCALVVLGGAAPVYLLLPGTDASPPPSVLVTATNDAAPKPAPAPAPERVAAKETAAADTATPDELPAPVDDVASTSPATDEAAPAEMAEPEVLDEPVPPAVAAVPTPRPERPDTQIAAIAEPSRLPVGPRPETSAAPPPGREAAREAPRERAPERLLVTIRPTAVRSAPGGAEIGVLARGAEVVVGRCDDWCEVSANGLRGWLHPSFLTEAGGRSSPRAAGVSDRSRPIARRGEEDRPVSRRRDAPAYEERWRDAPPRRDWRERGRERYVGGERWRRDDEDPVEFYGYE